MKTKLLLLVLTLLPCAASSQHVAPAQLISRVDNLLALISDRFEVDTQREYLPVNVAPRDRWMDESGYLVFLTIEGRGGSNTFRQWAAWFALTTDEIADLQGERPKQQYFLVDVVEVGGKFERAFEFSEAVQKGVVVEIPFSLWTPQDPGCCPTGKGIGHLKFQQGQLFVE